MKPSYLLFLFVFPVSLHAQEAVPKWDGIERGLVVHLGVTDGKLEEELTRSGRYLVHGLATDAKAVSELRQRLADANLGGLAVIEGVNDWKRLPYPDRFVNVLIADFDALEAPPAKAECMRVLVSEGIVQAVGPELCLLDLTTGKRLWTRKDGKELWRHVFIEKDWTNTVEASRVVIRSGTAYYLGGKGIRAFDATTGEPRTDFLKRPRYAFNGFGECSGLRGTVNWLIANGLCYWDPDLKLTETWAARSSYGTGVIPANGMIYALPTGCDCTSYSRGYLGLSSTLLPEPVMDEKRLVVGKSIKRPPSKTDAKDWPFFLGNPQRTGATEQMLPDKLDVLWRCKAAQLPTGDVAQNRRHSEYWIGPLSAPVASGDLIVVAAPEEYAVRAVDAKTGKVRWLYQAGSKVDSPPTLHDGLAFFGCHDGWVYALNLEDGSLAWRFLAAPTEQKAMLHGHLTSAFPVHGSPLILDGKVLVTAGFHSYLGGIHAWVLEPATGKILGRGQLHGGKEMLRPVVNDILSASADGKSGWLALDAEMKTDGTMRVRPHRAAKVAEESPPLVVFERNAAFLRFYHDQRGGSTHGWNNPMSAGGARGQRIVWDGKLAFALTDPQKGQLHPVHASKSVALSAVAGRTYSERKVFWQATLEQLGRKESYSALLKAGSRLYLGGGTRDGSSGFLQVVSAEDGKLMHEIPLPARVSECGLALARGRLIVSCENGEVCCLGKK